MDRVDEIRKAMRRALPKEFDRRIDTICSMLDPNIAYKYEHINNKVVLENVLYSLKDINKYITKDIFAIYGNVIMEPRVMLFGDFICLHIVTQTKYFNAVVKEDRLITYVREGGAY